MQKEYNFSGSTGGRATIIINNNLLTIKRKGLNSFAVHGMNAEKTIKIENITCVQYKKSGFSAGYIQFIVMGSQESKGKLHDNLGDENTVGFVGKKYNEQALEIKEYIENYNSNNNGTTIIQNVKSPVEQVKELKELLDIGAISQEEFDKKKKELLNL